MLAAAVLMFRLILGRLVRWWCVVAAAWCVRLAVLRLAGVVAVLLRVSRALLQAGLRRVPAVAPAVVRTVVRTVVRLERVERTVRHRDCWH